MQSGGATYFTGSLSAGAVTIDTGGAITGDGTLTAAGGGAILNNGTIEAVADQTLGLQRLSVASDLSGTGTLIIDAGATLRLGGAVASTQTITFAANSIAQLANDPYSPSTLVLDQPDQTLGTISGFSFADRLVLQGVTITQSPATAGSTLTVNLSTGGPLSFTLTPANLTGLIPNVISGNTIAFVAPTAAGVAPTVAAPAHARGRRRGARVRAEHRYRDAASSHRAHRPDGHRQACDGRLATACCPLTTTTAIPALPVTGPPRSSCEARLARSSAACRPSPIRV